MDWRTDQKVRDLDDEFMFGPAFSRQSGIEAQGAQKAAKLYLPEAMACVRFLDWKEAFEAGRNSK